MSVALESPRSDVSLAAGPGVEIRPALDSTGDLRFQLFATIFALGTLHHEIQFILVQQTSGPFAGYMERLGQVHPSVGWPSSVGVGLHLANVSISLLILVLPWRRALLGLLTIPFLLSNLTIPLGIASHNTLMAGALALILLLGLLELADRVLQRGRASVGGTDWYGWTLIGLTWLCALTYAFAAFHKLNPRWFSPANSPGVDFILMTLRSLGLPRDAAGLLGYPIIFGVVVVEGGLPFLLMHRRTRLFGCLLGCLFHLPMLAAGVMDFPTVILAFYPLFLSVEEARAVLARCLTRPSLVRLGCTAAVGGIGAVAISRAEQPNSYYVGSLGLEPLLMVAHSALLYLTFFLVVYVACTLAALLIDRRATGTSVRAPARS